LADRVQEYFLDSVGGRDLLTKLFTKEQSQTNVASLETSVSPDPQQLLLDIMLSVFTEQLENNFLLQIEILQVE
jgi:hypothetical protein